jgi:serine/threonine protein kinase
MDPAVWSRIKELALEALDHPPSERGRFLDSRGIAGDMRLAVERLVHADESASREDFLHPPPAMELPTDPGELVEEDAAALVGARIGHYRVRRLIGTGGMGAVYEAVQEHPRRSVALKMMRAGLASKSHSGDLNMSRISLPGCGIRESPRSMKPERTKGREARRPSLPWSTSRVRGRSRCTRRSGTWGFASG